MSMRSDSGKGGLRTLLVLIFIAGMVFSAAKIVPTYVDNYELENYLKHLAVQATVQSPPMSAEAVQNAVLEKTNSLGLPVERKDIKVSLSRTVRIDLDYSVYVDLKFYVVTLHFTPSAENSNII